MKHIYLIGMPGCGKSTLGKRLSSALGLLFCDLDAYIEEREGKQIPELFQCGEAHFRDAESRALKQISEEEKCVVSTGGGIIVREENEHIMKNSGAVIFIDSAPETIISRADLSDRPLIGADAKRIYTLYEDRIFRYRSCADITVENNGNFEDALERLLSVAKQCL